MTFRRLPRLGSLRRLVQRQQRQSEQAPAQPAEEQTLDVSREGRRSFQRRLPVRRVGLDQPDAGPLYLEARAAQDTGATLAVRIVLKELRRRMEVFQFTSDNEGGLALSGYPIPFLLTLYTPAIALDVWTEWNRLPEPEQETKAAIITAAGFRYAYLKSEDVFESQQRLEYLLDEILGKLATPSLAPAIWPPRMDEGTADEGGFLLSLSSIELLKLIRDNEVATAKLARDSERMAIPMRNSSGAMVPEGSCVKLDTAVTQELAFTTSTTQGDRRVALVALESIPANGRGLVALTGYIRRVRVAAGTTIYQYLRQSTTAGVAEGITAEAVGIFGISVSGRDSTLGTAEAIVFPLEPDVPDTQVPRFALAVANAITIRMIYDEQLDTGSVPATTAFSIVINGGTPANPSGVAINGNVVVLTHLSTLVSTDTVTVSYTAPGSNMIQDLAGNDAANLTAQTCVNVSESARVYKSANEIVNNSAALQNDNHLTFACQANKSYRVKLFGRFSSSVTADIKLDLSVPTGASHQMLGVTQAGGGTIIALDVTLSGSGVGTILSFILEGVVIIGGTAGSVTFQWAQNVAEVSDTTVYKDSYLIYELLN